VPELSATYRTTPNIAVIKYWGKRDEKFVLPQNSSLSFTLDETLHTTTTVVFSSKFTQDNFWLNSEKISFERYAPVISLIRNLADTKDRVHIASINQFPTAAGLASSASGISALTSAACDALNLNLSKKQKSILSRQGSGSAARSIFGGCVLWHRGQYNDGSDSYAEQLFPSNYWSDLCILVIITNFNKKNLSSRKGMTQTVQTSPLYQERLKQIPKKIELMKKAICKKDFSVFAELTMKESNQLHAVMLDSWPPIIYLDDAAKLIISSINQFNHQCNQYAAAYTFDAGSNAYVFTTQKYAQKLSKRFSTIPGIYKILSSRIGTGPRKLIHPKNFLIDVKTGKPRLLT